MANQWTTERVLEAVREWVWIPHDALRDDSQPADLQDQLLDHGSDARRGDRHSRDQHRAGLPPDVVVDHVSVRRICDKTTVRDGEMIAAVAFETEPPPSSRRQPLQDFRDDAWHVGAVEMSRAHGQLC